MNHPGETCISPHTCNVGRKFSQLLRNCNICKQNKVYILCCRRIPVFSIPFIDRIDLPFLGYLHKKRSINYSCKNRDIIIIIIIIIIIVIIIIITTHSLTGCLPPPKDCSFCCPKEAFSSDQWIGAQYPHQMQQYSYSLP